MDDQMPYPGVVMLVGELLQALFGGMIALLLMRWLLSLFMSPTMRVEVSFA